MPQSRKELSVSRITLSGSAPADTVSVNSSSFLWTCSWSERGRRS